MKYIFFFITICAVLLFSLNGAEASNKLRISAGFYPLAHFAEKVGGYRAEVINITPPGAEPHEFEPSPRDYKNIWTSKIFIFNGAHMTPWAERISRELEKKGIYVIEMAEHFDMRKAGDEHEDHDEGGEHDHDDHEAHHEEHDKEAHKDEHDHDHGGLDPHIWLDPLLAIKEIKIIRDAFIKVDPENKDYYKRNSSDYINKLTDLHKRFEEGLKSCEIRDIIVSHDAFSYLANRYDLHVHSISGISPQEEPSPRTLADLTRLARDKEIKYIFFEALVSPRLAKTIAGEVGAKTLTLNPIGGLRSEDIKAGKDYISIMDENLNNLRTALSCN